MPNPIANNEDYDDGRPINIHSSTEAQLRCGAGVTKRKKPCSSDGEKARIEGGKVGRRACGGGSGEAASSHFRVGVPEGLRTRGKKSETKREMRQENAYMQYIAISEDCATGCGECEGGINDAGWEACLTGA